VIRPPVLPNRFGKRGQTPVGPFIPPMGEPDSIFEIRPPKGHCFTPPGKVNDDDRVILPSQALKRSKRQGSKSISELLILIFERGIPAGSVAGYHVLAVLLIGRVRPGAQCPKGEIQPQIEGQSYGWILEDQVQGPPPEPSRRGPCPSPFRLPGLDTQHPLRSKLTSITIMRRVNHRFFIFLIAFSN